MDSCELCHGDERLPNDVLCGDCRQYENFWNSLSEAEKVKELEMMSDYVEEHSDGV